RSNPTQASVYNLGTGADGYNPVLGTSRAQKGLGFFETDSQRLGHSLVYAYGAELTVKYQLSDAVALMSLTSYDHVRQAFTQEGTGLESPLYQQPLDTLYGNRFTMFNQELRASYSAGHTNAQAGLYYGYDKDASNSYYWLLDGAAMDHQIYDQIRKSYALFAQADQKFGDHLGVTVGLRYTWDRLRYQNYTSYLTPSSLYTGTPDTTIFPFSQGTYVFGAYNAATGGYTSGPTIPLSSQALTGRLAINYTFTGGHMLYASYGRGYRSAAYCGQCFLGPTITTTRPESVDAYEIGAKGRFADGHLSLAVAAFLMNYRNQQINETEGAQVLLDNVPKSQIKGAEIDGSWTPLPGLKLALNGSYIDARYKSA
ncbi:MAG TPA: TonB-dependent receptor, partial [Novosphingobium sp.]|nr:TonB-dependent receptor [Novosphingobium sp.]